MPSEATHKFEPVDRAVVMLYNDKIDSKLCGKSRRAFFFARRFLPYKPKRPCSHPGCPMLTHNRFCDEHAKQEAKRYELYDRDPAVHKRYGRAWKRIRNIYITAHPLCEQCLKTGIYTSAHEVHHIKPLSQGGTHADSNLMALCTSCHSSITAREGCRWG